ncbi:MAG: hypothetical protein AAGF89_05280, partial [Bacteroidota bacterium]
MRGIPKDNPFVEDAEGYFWFTDGNHVDLLHRKTCEVLPLEEKFPAGIPFSSPIEHLWAARDGGIYLKELGSQAFFHYHPSTGITELSHLKGSGAVYATASGLWAHDNKLGWRKFDYLTHEILAAFKIKWGGGFIHGYRAPEDWFSYFDPITKETVLLKIGTIAADEIMRIPAEKGNPKFKYQILYHKPLDLLILNAPYTNGELVAIDPDAKKVIPIGPAPGQDPPAFHSTLYVDREGILWRKQPSSLGLLKISKPIFTRYGEGLASRGLWANENRLLVQSAYIDFNQPETIRHIMGLTQIQSVLTTDKKEIWL